jgi:hypothetical protein
MPESSDGLTVRLNDKLETARDHLNKPLAYGRLDVSLNPASTTQENSGKRVQMMPFMAL